MNLPFNMKLKALFMRIRNYSLKPINIRQRKNQLHMQALLVFCQQTKPKLKTKRALIFPNALATELKILYF